MPEGKGRGRMKRVKRVKYMMMKEILSLGSECTMHSADDALQNCILETYIMLLTHVTPTSVIKN